jgi:hypothetical protein
MANVIEVDIKLDARQRQVLSAYVAQEGWDITQLLMIQVIKDFNDALMNAPVNEPQTVLAKHCIAKAAAQIYAGLMQKISDELSLERYNAAKLGTAANPEMPNVSPEFQ